MKVVFQTSYAPLWPSKVPIPESVVDDQISPIDGLRFGSLRWASSRFMMTFRNGYRRWLLAKKIKADIVHIQLVLPWVDWLFIPLHRRSSKVVCTIHDVVPHVFKLPPAIDRFLRGYCYGVADGVIFHTADNISQFKAVYSFLPHSLAVIPLGLTWYGLPSESDIIQARQSIGIPEDRLIVLMFGELRPNKGLDILVQAFSQVLLDAPKAFLLIVGPVHPTVSVDKFILQLQKLPINSWSWRRGWIDDEEVGNYFKAASVVVLPYTAFASQSGVLAKAYAYSRPLVVSDVGGLGATVRGDGTGLVVPPSNVTELASALSRFLREPALGAACQDKIVQLAQQYSWDNVARRTAEFYECILRQ